MNSTQKDSAIFIEAHQGILRNFSQPALSRVEIKYILLV